MKNKFKIRFAATLLLLAVLGIGLVVWASNENVNLDRLHIENKTHSLVVESVKNLGEKNELSQFEITVRNSYEKPIAVYRLRIKDESKDKDTISAVEIGAFTDGWTLQPNETSTTKFSAASKGNIILTIAAIIFEDGTGDGYIDDLTRLRENHLGVKLAFQKITAVIKESTKTDNLAPSELVSSLENKIAEISDESVPTNSKRGFAQAKSYIGFELKDIRQKIDSTSGAALQTEIEKQLTKIEDTLTKLSGGTPLKTIKGGQK